MNRTRLTHPHVMAAEAVVPGMAGRACVEPHTGHSFVMVYRCKAVPALRMGVPEIRRSRVYSFGKVAVSAVPFRMT